MACYDVSRFHPDCGGVVCLSSNNGISVWCPKCGVLADANDIGLAVSPVSAFMVGKGDRQIIRQPTKGIPGEEIYKRS